MNQPAFYRLYLVPSASHAVRGETLLIQAGIPCVLIPVPRSISSQCGVCLRVEIEFAARAGEALVRAGVQVAGTHDLWHQNPRDEEAMNMHAGDDSQSRPGSTVVAISSNTMGRGDDELGQVLLRSYLHTLTEVTPRPDTLIFFNSGVKLATEGSQSLDDLRLLADHGVQILLCGTCLGHFELKERVVVGEVSNMYAISETMLLAGKVIDL